MEIHEKLRIKQTLLTLGVSKEWEAVGTLHIELVLTSTAAHSCCRAQLMFSGINSLSSCRATHILTLQLLDEIALYSTEAKTGCYGEKRIGLCVFERLKCPKQAYNHVLLTPTNSSPPKHFNHCCCNSF